MPKIKPDPALAEWQAAQPSRPRSGQYAFDKSTRTFVARGFDRDDPHDFLPSEDEVPDNDRMNTPTREEFEARIAASEARSDARFIAFEKRVDESMHRIELELAPLKNIKISIWSAAATIIATFIAVFAVYVSAFDSGRDTAQMSTEARAIAAQAQQETASALTQIRQIVSDLKAAQPQHK